MRNPSVREIVQQYLDVENSQHFACWAFGPGFNTMHETSFWTAWNERHGHELTLEGSGEPSVDIPHMIRIWQEHLVKRQNERKKG